MKRVLVPLVVAAALGMGALGANAPAARASGATVLPTLASSAIADLSCSTNVVFLGARGSSQAVDTATNGFGPEVNSVFSGFTTDLAADLTVQPVYVDYPAASTDSLLTRVAALTADPGNASSILGQDAFLQSVNQGMTQVNAVLTAVAHCPGQAVVLAGYSQGALVVHTGLSIADSVPESASTLDARLAALVLIADPASNGADAYPTVAGDNGQRGSASDVATASESGRVGLMPALVAQFPALAAYAPMPSPLDATQAGRVLNICDANDLICDTSVALAVQDAAGGTGTGPRAAVHAGYLDTGVLPDFGAGAAFQTNLLLGHGLEPQTFDPAAAPVWFQPVQGGSELPVSVLGVPGLDAAETFTAYTNGTPASRTLDQGGASVQYDGQSKLQISPGSATTVALTVQYALGSSQPIVHDLFSRVLSGDLSVIFATPTPTPTPTPTASVPTPTSRATPSPTALAAPAASNPWVLRGVLIMLALVLVVGGVGALVDHRQRRRSTRARRAQ